jgi:hypothetical protein
MFSIPDKYIIHDLRNSKEFKKLTISGYKIQDVSNAYQNSMINNNLEDSIRWCVELHCTGLENNIWNSLYILITKHIHVNNPKLFIYFKKRQKEYDSIITNYPPKFYHIYSKNNQEIRHMFAELTSLCCLTKKNNIFLNASLPKLGKNFFDKNNLSKRMIASDLDNIIDYCNNNTTKEMKLGLNEIYSNIESHKGTFDNCLYWYLWLEKVESIKKKDIKNDNEYNNITYNEEQDENELWVLIIWKIINKHKSIIDDNDKIFIKKIFNDYTNDLKSSNINKKKYLIFMAFYVLKKKINWSIQLYQQEHLLLQVIGNINKMYEKIKVNNESHLDNDSKNILYKNFNKLFYRKYDKDEVKIKKPVKIFDNRINPDDNKILFTKHPEFEQISKKKKVEFITNDKEQTKNNTQRNSGYNNLNQKINELKTINYRNNIINEHKFNNPKDDISNDEDENSYNDESDYEDDNRIGKSITNEDILNAKNERLEKKINAFKQIISYKKNTNLEEVKNNNTYSEELKNIEIIKKRRNDN